MRVIKRTGHRSDRCTYLGNHPQDRDIKHWTSLVFQWFRLCLPMQKSWVRSLVGELRPHILWSVAQKKEKKKNDTEHLWPTCKLPHVTWVTSPTLSSGCHTSFLSLQTSFAFPRITYKWRYSMRSSGISVCVAGFFYSILFFEGLTYCVG